MALIANATIKITGSSLSGSNAETDRTYTLADNTSPKGLIIVVENAFLQPDADFTFNESTYLVTFLNPVWDINNITIYSNEEAVSDVGNFYTTTLNLVRVSGIGVDVTGESLGTGDNSTTAYDTENNNIINESYKVYYTDTDSNSATILEEDVDYEINKDRGTIELTNAGVTKVNTKLIFIDYTYSPRQSNTILYSYLEFASAEVDRLTGNHWGTATTRTDYFNGFYSNYPSGDEPYSKNANDRQPEFQLNYEGVNSITSVKFISQAGDEYQTLDTNQYRLVEDNRLIINATVPNGQANVEIIYEAGYESVPILISELTALIAGKMALVNISGGSYKDISTYSIGRKSFSIGMIYVNVESSLKRFEDRINTILDSFGRNFSCV